MKFLSLLLIFLLSNEILSSVGKKVVVPPSSDTDNGYINESESIISKAMMNTPIIRSFYGCIRLVVNVYKDRKRSTREFPPELEIQDKYDARKAYPNCKTIGTITKQGCCASCWAVAVVNAFSDRICIHSKGEKNYHMSVQQMIACNRQNNGCWGGEIYTAWKFLEEFPLVTGGPYRSQEGCQPYLISTHEAADKLKCSREVCPITHKAKEIIVLPQDEKEIQREIQYYGPVSAQMSFHDSLYDYKKGHVYQKQPNESKSGPHFVRIIGWGVTEDEYQLKYWIIADSFLKIGEEGIFKILRGANECDIESFVVSGLPDFYSPSN